MSRSPPVAREARTRAGMVITILALLFLIFITPSLLGRPPELASLPLLIIGLTQDESTFVVDVGGAVGAYMYANVTLEVLGIDNASYQARVMNASAYHLHVRVPRNATPFAVHTLLVDRQDNYFEYNITASLATEATRLVMIFTFPDETDNRVERRTPPDDLRWAVPWRGSL